MPTIELTGAGPIEGTFTIDLSKGFGAYELRGARGTGKTTLISSIDWLSGHKVDITLHDAAVSGKVEGFGVVAPIGGRKRRKGEFELDTIDAEKFSLTDLIDPPGKTPEVRDAHAIKALAVLSEAQADPKLYYELAGGQAAFDALGIQDTDDPVLLAKRVKEAFDGQARVKERTAEAEVKHAVPLEHVPDDLDVNQSSDLETLGAERDAARDKAKTLADTRTAGLAKEVEVQKAVARLSKVKAEYKGPPVTMANKALAQVDAAVDEAAERVRQMQEELAVAVNAHKDAMRDKEVAQNRWEAAKQHEEAVSMLEATASQNVEYPSAEEIVSAQTEVAKATQVYDQGLRIRDVKQNQGKAAQHREAAKKAEKEAAEARNKAAAVFDLLATSLHTKHLQIKTIDGNPRLFVQHPKRGRTAFDRVNGLSDGERVDFTLRELLPYIDSPGCLPVPQRVWQDLQPSDRKRLHEIAADKGHYIFGAQVDEGPLRVVYLGDDNGELF